MSRTLLYTRLHIYSHTLHHILFDSCCTRFYLRHVILLIPLSNTKGVLVCTYILSMAIFDLFFNERPLVMDVMNLNPSKKKDISNGKVSKLAFTDFKYPENHLLSNSRKLKLPSLISSKLPDEILNKLQMRNDSSMKSSIDIRSISEFADDLKTKSISSFKKNDFTKSIIQFFQSYVLFILVLRLKEIKNDENKEEKMEESAEYLNNKMTDWINTLSFGEKIIDNFTKLLNDRVKKIGSKDKKYILFSYIIGLTFYSNGLIQIHVCKILEKQMKLMMKLKTTGQGTPEFKKLLARFNNFNTLSIENFKKGELNLGLFEIAREFPQLWTQSYTKLKSIKTDDIVVAYRMVFFDKNVKLKTGVNYILPICTHMWTLDMILNFSGFFLKEWVDKIGQTSFKNVLIFEY